MLDSPIDFFEKTYRKISKNEKIAFISALLFGLACHIFMLTNKLPNHDELHSYRYLGTTVSNGRPLLRLAQYISGTVSSPWIEGTVAILYISVIGLLLNRIFDIKSKLSSILISLTLVTFPTVASCLGHMYSADVFYFSILCGVISINVLNSKKDKKQLSKHIIMTSFVMAIGMCVYQITIAYAITLIVMIFITKELGTEKNLSNNDWLDELKAEVLKFVLFVIFSVIIYFIILKVSLVITGATLTDRKGIGSAGIGTVLNMPFRVIEAYKQFGWYIFQRNSSTTFSIIAKTSSATAAIAAFCSCIYLAYKNNIFSSVARSAFFIFLILVLPLSVESIYVLVQRSSDVNFHMHQSLVLWFVFLVIVMDRMAEYSENLSKKVKKGINEILWIFMICIGFMQWDNWLFTANAYNAAYLAYEQTYAYSLELAIRIKEVDGFTYDKPIAFVGKFNYEDKPATLSVLRPFTAVSSNNLVTSLPGELTLITTYAYPNFFVYYLGNDFNFCSKEKNAEISTMEEVKNMPIYPQDGSIRVIDGIIVVNR